MRLVLATDLDLVRRSPGLDLNQAVRRLSILNKCATGPPQLGEPVYGVEAAVSLVIEAGFPARPALESF